MEFSQPLDPNAIAAYHREQESLGGPWEVAYGFVGNEPSVVRCFNEAEAEALVFELQRLHFAGASNWKISAYRVDT
jgi:hypothetical protein